MTVRKSRPLVKGIARGDNFLSRSGRKTVIRLLSVLLAALVLAMPVTATAQEQLGSVTIKKLPISLDTPGVHPVKFELSGGDLTAPVTLYSDTDTVRFSDLTPGTYRIRELATRTGDVARATITPVKVSIPHGELFDVVIYPKPQPLTLLKSADVKKITPGSDFRYTLDGPVPLPDTNGQLHRYVLRDALSKGLTLTGPSSMQLRIGSRVVPLTAGEHYAVTNQGGRVITATFTPAGLALLAQERGNNANMVVRFSFEVRASADLRLGSYVLNIAHLYPDGYPETGGDSVVSNEHFLPVTDYGRLIIPGLPLIPGSPGSSLPNLSGTPDLTTDSTRGAPSSETPTPSIIPESPERPTRSGGLASTGASVLGMIALGSLLTMIGITLSKRGRRD